MKLLLDTHTLLWLASGDAKLTLPARNAIANPANTLTISVATIWELAIKTTKNLRSLTLSDPLETYLAKCLPTYGIDILPILQSHALRVMTLPDHHRDPFDRIIIAQAICEDMTLVTGDTHASSYPVSLIW